MLDRSASPSASAERTSVTDDAPRHAVRPALLRPGHNCWRIERATRLAFLVDGAEYFGAVRHAIAHARRSFFVLGWDIDTRMQLVPQGADDGLPGPLGAFLNEVVARRRGLRGHVLTWDFAMLYALEREWTPIFGEDWKTHRRLAFKLDDQHPVGASHHQKVVVVDDDVAFVSGFDLAGSRWDTSAHDCTNPHRVNADGTPYAPFHDVGVVVSGPCARALGELCRERWKRATGLLPRVGLADVPSPDTWPPTVAAVLVDQDIAIARTEPAHAGRPQIDEVRQLHLDAIASARTSIFAENQYFTSPVIAEALAARLRTATGPDVALVMPATQSGWLEASTMGVLRARVHRDLRAADRAGRYVFYCPKHACAGPGGPCINVHSKVLVVDDAFLTVGSANLANRSLSLDTECNLALEAGGNPAVRRAIAGLRERLLGEHLGVPAAAVAAATARECSLHAAIAALQGEGHARRLEATEPVLDATRDALTPAHDVLDPEHPLDPDLLLRDLLPEERSRSTVRWRLAGIGAAILLLAGLALAWRYTPLASYVSFDSLLGMGERLRETAWAPFVVPLAFVLGGLAMVPVMLMIGATVTVFGPIGGFLLAFAGAMASAAFTYALGRALGRHTVRRIAGRRLNALSQRLARRGLLAMVLVRLLPIAPYTVVNVVAGASHIGWRDFLLGTALGLLPGMVMTTAFVDRAVAALRAPTPATVLALVGVLAVIVAATWALHARFRTSDRAPHAQPMPRDAG